MLWQRAGGYFGKKEAGSTEPLGGGGGGERKERRKNSLENMDDNTHARSGRPRSPSRERAKRTRWVLLCKGKQGEGRKGSGCGVGCGDVEFIDFSGALFVI